MIWSRKGLGLLLLLCLLLAGCCGPTRVTQDTWRGQEIRPYVGLVRNFADVDIVLPSANSSAAIIVPAQGSVEYTVWQPSFTLSGYVGGKEVYCRRLQVQPQRYSVFCKKYDFLAEIYPESAATSDTWQRWQPQSVISPPAPSRRSQRSTSG